MPRVITNPVQAARLAMASDGAWMWLVRVERAAGGYYRVSSLSRTVTADGADWQGAAVSVAPAEENARGDLGAFTVTIGNHRGILSRLVEADGEIVGREFVVYIAHESDLDHPVEICRGSCSLATIDAASGVMTCGERGQSRRVPARVFTPDRFPQVVQDRGGTI